MNEKNTPIDACEDPLLELQMTLASLWNDRKRLCEERIQISRALKIKGVCGEDAAPIEFVLSAIETYAKPITEHRDVQKLIKRVEQQYAENKALKKSLEMARCPDTSCQDGAVPVSLDPDGVMQVTQCQWCDERDQILGKRPHPILKLPLLCVQHGGSSKCEEINKKYGFHCPQCDGGDKPNY